MSAFRPVASAAAPFSPVGALTEETARVGGSVVVRSHTRRRHRRGIFAAVAVLLATSPSSSCRAIVPKPTKTTTPISLFAIPPQPPPIVSAAFVSLGRSFRPSTTTLGRRRRSRSGAARSLLDSATKATAGDDYEFIPPDPSSHSSSSSNNRRPSLPSSYPESIPPALRGEAVRSALLSSRGCCVDFGTTRYASENLNVGALKVEGEGTTEFLEGKFSNSFPLPPPPTTDDVVGDVGVARTACLLTPRGRTVDLVSVCVVSKTEAYIVSSPGHVGTDVDDDLDGGGKRTKRKGLFERLDPLVFPMDRVELFDLRPGGGTSKNGTKEAQTTKKTKVFAILSSSLPVAENVVSRYVLPRLLGEEAGRRGRFRFPSEGECVRLVPSEGIDVVIARQTFLPSCAAVGYSILIAEPSGGHDDDGGGGGDSSLSDEIWEASTDETDMEGPVELGPLEYETLRIESGRPGYGFEMTGDDDDLENENEGRTGVKANPLELGLLPPTSIDPNKGCYLGQEGVASVLKNPRGPPRTLYSVSFDDDSNLFAHETEGGRSYQARDRTIDNLTFLPKPGDELFVLGSDESIKVGVLTSVAERGGTGEPTTVALALIRRADSILSKMKEMDLDVGYVDPFLNDPLWSDDVVEGFGGGNAGGSKSRPPAGRGSVVDDDDPLDGLEVIVGGTYTVGTVRPIPSSRYRDGRNMFEEARRGDEVAAHIDRDDETAMGFVGTKPAAPQDGAPLPPTEDAPKEWEVEGDEVAAGGGGAADSAGGVVEAEASDDDDDDEALSRATEEAKKAAEDAAAAVAEAQRKADKMELLKRRAEEATARRKKRKKEEERRRQEETDAAEREAREDADAEAEARRKAEKMERLRRRAEEAMARRRERKGTEGKGG